MKKNWYFILLFCLSNLKLSAQEVKGETIIVLKGGITVIRFNSAVVNCRLGDKDDYYVSVEEGTSVRLGAKSGVGSPKTTNLIVTEGKRNHMFTITYQEKGDFNKTYYDYSDLKALKKKLAEKPNQETTTNSEEPDLASQEEAPVKNKSNSKEEKKKAAAEKKAAEAMELKIAEEKRLQAELDEKIAAEKNRQEEENAQRSKKNKEKQEQEKLAAEERKRKAKEEELARLADERAAAEEKQQALASQKEEQARVAKAKAEQEKLAVEERKRKQKEAELDRLQKEKDLAITQKEKQEQARIMAEEKKQQEQMNAKLLAERKQKEALEKQLAQEKAATEAKEALLEKERNAKLAKEEKLAQERKRRQELEDKIALEKQKKEEAERLAKEEREKFVLPPAEVDIRKQFPTVNFNEPPPGQYYDGMYYGDTSAYYLASQKLLDQPENPQFKNAGTEMDNIRVALCNIDFSGKAAYVRFKIENKTNKYFLLGATMLRILEAESGKKFQLNPYYISSFPIIPAGESRYVMYVMKPEQNISPESFVMVSVRDRQTNQKFELNFPGSFYTDALKKVQR